MGDEVENLKTNDFIQWIIFQGEKGEATKTYHLQGYFELKQPLILDELKLLHGLQRAHLAVRIKSRRAAIEYCRKKKTRVEGGVSFSNFPEGQGARTDLQVITTMVRDGRQEDEIWDRFPSQMIMYHRGIRQMLMFYNKKKMRPNPKLRIYVGATRTGKSLAACQEFPNAYWLSEGTTRPWYDGYAGERCIIVDEFRSWMKYTELLRLTDRYPFQLQTKGGTVPCIVDTVCMTSNLYPHEWYKGVPDRSALAGRIEEWGVILEFKLTELGLVKKDITKKECEQLRSDQGNTVPGHTHGESNEIFVRGSSSGRDSFLPFDLSRYNN